MRLIDADKAYKRLMRYTNNQHALGIKETLDAVPTVDAVPVVRCKDCIHREVQVDGVFRYEICGIRNEIINLDGFCHMGKRGKDAIR